MEATATFPIEPTPGSRFFAIKASLVLALAAALFFARLSERALWSEEVRWAEIPRAMQTSGDWLQPTINGNIYYDKPLGSYWLVLLAAFLTGELDETSARLPSALSGVVGVLLAMLIARRLYDEDAAILSGIILATSFAFVFFARTASADLENVTGILAALWFFLRNEGRPPGLWTFLLWLVMALTSLTKGLLGFALPILILGVYSSSVGAPTSFRAWLTSLILRNRWLFNRVSLVAIPLAALVYLGPFLLSIAVTGSTAGLEMVFRENLRRFFDPVNHRGPIYLYGYVIFLLLAPWSALLPAALIATEKGSRGRAFALAYFWATFIFFTLSASRRSYYLLPILPAGALLIARMLTRPMGLSRASLLLARAGFLLTGSIVLASAVALVPASVLLPEPWDTLPALPCPVAFIAMWLLCAASIGFTIPRFQPRRIATGFSIIAASVLIYLYLFALPALEVYRTQKPFAAAVRELVGADLNGVALYRTREIVYYLNPPAPLVEYQTPNDLAEGAGIRWIVLRRRDWEGLKGKGSIRVEETFFPWEIGAQKDSKLVLVEVGGSIDGRRQ